MGMTNPGFPPPLSSERREREAARVIDLRRDIETALDEVDAALNTEIEASRRRHPSAYQPAGGRADNQAMEPSESTKVSA